MCAKSRNIQKQLTSSALLSSVGIILIIIAIILIIHFLLQGKTTVTGQWDEPTKTEMLSCTKKQDLYPFFQYDNSVSKTTKVNLIFKNERIDSVALIYTLYYNDDEKIKDSININTIAMSESFANDRLKFNALGKYFSRMTNGVQFNLYANSNEINNTTSKYFLADYNTLSSERSIVKSAYENKKFDCVIND